MAHKKHFSLKGTHLRSCFMKRGSVTILLTLLFVSIFAAAAAVIEGSGRNAAMQTAEASYHLAGRSVLSMYDRQLQERYALMGVQNDGQKLRGWLSEYANTTIEGSSLINAESNVVSFDTEGYSLTIPSNFLTEIQEYEKATASASMLARKLQNCLKLSKASDSINNYKDRKKELEKDLDDAEEAAAEDEDNDVDFGTVRRVQSLLTRQESKYENKDSSVDPAAADHVLRNRDIINDLPSYENDVARPGMFFMIGNLSSMVTGEGNFPALYKLCLCDYLMNHMRNHQTGPDEYDESFFDNEVEYILFGNYSDVKNYEYAYRSIRSIRYASNLMFLNTDSTKRTEIDAMAELLTPGPWAVLTKTLITGAWAAYETHNDMRNIEEGYAVPLVKDGSTWKTDLDSLVNETDGDNDFLICQKNGSMNYKGYLEFLVLVSSVEGMSYRTMDVIQINLKGTVRSDFILEDHISGFSMKAEVRKKSALMNRFGNMSTYYVEQMHTYAGTIEQHGKID